MSKSRAKTKEIPHSFVLEQLESKSPYTKPMFGCRGVYVDDKIVFILRERESPIEDNGVWVATTVEHHESLRKVLPSLRSLVLFGPGPTGWQVLPAQSPSFEEEVLRACEMVLENDPRIGKVPARKRIGLRKRALAKEKPALRKDKRKTSRS